VRERWTRCWRWTVVIFGKPWVFWPFLAFSAVFRNGEPWGSVGLWLVALLAAGPGLACAIHRFSFGRQASALQNQTPS
jgi:hypothetical protein